MAATSKRPEIIALSQDLRGIPHCKEYERMISGIMYNPNTPKLLEMRHRCRGLARAFNDLDTMTIPSSQIFETRLALLRQLVGKVGEGTFIEPPFKPDYGCNVVIGSHCFIDWDVTVLDTSLVVIGDRVQIGTGVSIFTAGHDTSVLSRQKFVEFGPPVFVEDDCWIGGNVVILPGVRIGMRSTIRAGSIVTKDIPPFSVAVGAPCRVRKTIQSPEEEQYPNNPYRDLVREDQ
ncbi:trimeric LpxA-like protein [Aspergillus japonicus CBS 114.51]|uniref:Trimeric LpxA-like protein n=1 Tax=Aspergillus japonicus CBS 114.51 TaxID=1448312 RepID=A0A8T8WW58_ASPJA|nr:trimeric LpxA-like protein [Aspergillus japonicus CBS 114.51]RAH79662.1 trimeric LpxA-like protein [Aspergillus japonicus CBS 114.51]